MNHPPPPTPLVVRLSEASRQHGSTTGSTADEQGSLQEAATAAAGVSMHTVQILSGPLLHSHGPLQLRRLLLLDADDLFAPLYTDVTASCSIPLVSRLRVGLVVRGA